MNSYSKWIGVISISAATFLLASCGGGGGSSSSSEVSSSSEISSSSSESSQISSFASTLVRVCDAYVVNADVRAGTNQFNLEHEAGLYEINQPNMGNLALVSEGGVNDLNGDGEPSIGEPNAPDMKAPAGYAHISPFTTMLVNGVDIAAQADYQAVAQFAPLYDFDPVAAGAEFANGIAQATAIAALRLSAGGDGSMELQSSSSYGDDSLPGAGGSVASSSSIVVQSSSSSVSGVTSAPSGGVLPQAIGYRGILPGNESSTGTSSSLRSSSSSIVSSVSSASSSSVLSSVASSSSSVSSTLNMLQQAIDAIKNAKNLEELNLLLKTYMAYYNGSYANSSASSSLVMSSSSQSSAIGTSDDCLPGYDCASSSSSLVSSISSSSAQSSTLAASSSSVNSAQQVCIAAGGTWIPEVNGCSMPATSSSSSSKPSTGGGTVLPQ
ncbi:MAG: hypothetical protein JXK05_05155 [Campylobacterales bacterium]|nr:hypothetical protein [Campylobacterales bacterium]